MILYTALLLRFTPSLTAAIPPNTITSVVVAVGEELTLSCPLQFMESFGQFYRLEWRVNDMPVAGTNPPDSTSCACLNGRTLDLTVGLVNSSLPKYECVILAFQRREELSFGNAPKGTVNINLACKSQYKLMNLYSTT